MQLKVYHPIISRLIYVLYVDSEFTAGKKMGLFLSWSWFVEIKKERISMIQSYRTTIIDDS